MSRTERRWAELCDAHLPSLIRFLVLVRGDPVVAETAARRTLRVALLLWRDRRWGEDFGIRLRGTGFRRWGSWRGELRDEDERRWSALRPRQRAALALELGEGFSRQQVALALRCSEAAVVGMRRRAVDRLGPSATSIVERLGRALVEGPPDSAAVPRWVILGRALVPVGSVAVAALTALAVLGVTVDALRAGQGSVKPMVARTQSDDAKRVFPSCPDVTNVIRPSPEQGRSASRSALLFNSALVRSDGRVLARLADHSVISLDPDRWGHTLVSRGLRVTHSGRASGDGRAHIGCGRTVAERSWKVVMHDSSRTAGAGTAGFYLVLRRDGWKVWGSYGGRRL